MSATRTVSASPRKPKTRRATKWKDVPQWTHNVAVAGLIEARENNRSSIAIHPELASHFLGFMRDANIAIRVLRELRAARTRRRR